MEYSFLKINTINGICTLAISAPKSLNALNSTILKEMDDFLNNIPAEVRVLIITGDGDKSFVAGADISEMQNLNEQQGYEFSTMAELKQANKNASVESIMAKLNKLNGMKANPYSIK